MSGALVSIGGAQLLVRGLNPQRIGSRSEARVPGIPTWTGMDYQTTGMGEASVRLEALTYPHFIMRKGDPRVGLDALERLQEKWQASGVTHDVVPDRGWTTTIETETTPG